MSPSRKSIDEQEGIAQQPGVETTTVEVAGQTIHVPADHNGQRIKVELPDGEIAYTEGWDPAERALAGERPIVPCGNCGAPQTLVSDSFSCSACGAQNTVELRASVDRGVGHSAEGG